MIQFQFVLISYLFLGIDVILTSDNKLLSSEVYKEDAQGKHSIEGVKMVIRTDEQGLEYIKFLTEEEFRDAWKDGWIEIDREFVLHNFPLPETHLAELAHDADKDTLMKMMLGIP